MTTTWQGGSPLEAYDASALDRRAQAFHKANPHVLARLIREARSAKAQGATRLSIALLFERLRWLAIIETKGDVYRLNNSHRAWYARAIMTEAPDLAGLFATRDAAHDDAYHTKVDAQTVTRAARVLRAARDMTRRVPPPSRQTPEPRPAPLFPLI